MEERDPQSQDQVAFHIVDRWRYIAKLAILEDLYDLGYQLLDSNNRPNSLVDEVLEPTESNDNHFDLDIYFILVRFLVNQKKMNMNCLKIWPLVGLSSEN